MDLHDYRLAHLCISVLWVVDGRSPVVHLHVNYLQYDVPTVVSMIQPLIFGHTCPRVHGGVLVVYT